jgi:hypothetical protein
VTGISRRAKYAAMTWTTMEIFRMSETFIIPL